MLRGLSYMNINKTLHLLPPNFIYILQSSKICKLLYAYI